MKKRNENNSCVPKWHQKNEITKDYQSIVQEINKILASESKPVQIRIKEWLIKFQSVVEVELWQRNRNLYCKTLLTMLKSKTLGAPFHKLPPSTSLPILSLYEIPFDIRKQLDKQKTSHPPSFKCFQQENQKQNRGDFGNTVNLEGGLNQQRSKQKYAYQDKIIHKHSLQNVTIDENAPTDRDICNNVRRSYDFIIKNYSKFSSQDEVNTLLEELWNFTANP